MSRLKRGVWDSRRNVEGYSRLSCVSPDHHTALLLADNGVGSHEPGISLRRLSILEFVS